MEIKLEKLPKSRIKLEVETTSEEVQPFFDQALEKLANSVNIAGFRPGKAPKLMIIESVGLNRYNSTALDLAFSQIYHQAVIEKKVSPISSPNISIEQFSEGKPFKFIAEVDIVPEIRLGDYNSIKIKSEKVKEDYPVEDSEVESLIKRLQYRDAKFSEIDQAAKKDDYIEIDYEGSVKGVIKEGMASKNHPLILGEGVLVPGFEDQLVGMKKDDKKEITVKVKGDNTLFKVKMNVVKKVELPELDEAFFKKFGHKSLENLKKAIKKSLSQEKKDQAKGIIQQELLAKLAEKSQVEVPQSLVEDEVNRKITQMQGNLGVLFDEYLKKNNKDLPGLRKELTQPAEKQVKIGLVLGETAKELGIIKEPPKTQEEQSKIIKRTIDKLIEIITK